MTNQTRTEPMDRLAELEQAATPGPWQDIGQVIGAGRHRVGDTQDVACYGHSGQECTDDEMERWAMADAAFIAELRNAAPSLIAEAREAARLRTALLSIYDMALAQPFDRLAIREVARAALVKP